MMWRGQARQIDPTGKSLLIFRNRVKPKNQKESKIFRFPRRAHQWHSFRHPGPPEGRFAIVTMRWAGMRWTLLFQARKRRRMSKGVRRSRVVLAPRRWR